MVKHHQWSKLKYKRLLFRQQLFKRLLFVIDFNLHTLVYTFTINSFKAISYSGIQVRNGTSEIQMLELFSQNSANFILNFDTASTCRLFS